MHWMNSAPAKMEYELAAIVTPKCAYSQHDFVKCNYHIMLTRTFDNHTCLPCTRYWETIQTVWFLGTWYSSHVYNYMVVKVRISMLLACELCMETWWSRLSLFFFFSFHRTEGTIPDTLLMWLHGNIVAILSCMETSMFLCDMCLVAMNIMLQGSYNVLYFW